MRLDTINQRKQNNMFNSIEDNENLSFEEALGYSERIIQDRSVFFMDGHYKINGHYKLTRKGT